MKRLFLFLFFVACVPQMALAQSSGNARLITATPTVDTAAYVTGDLVGGKLTWTNALKPITGTGYLVSVNMMDQSAQAIDFDIVIFSFQFVYCIDMLCGNHLRNHNNIGKHFDRKFLVC